MSWLCEFGNCAVYIGRDHCRYQGFIAQLLWNNRERIVGSVLEGEQKYADEISIVWRWRPFRDFRVYRYHMHWKKFWRASP